jgi:hypothetical protein
MGNELQILNEVDMLVIQATAFQTKAEGMIVEEADHVMAATNLMGFIAQSKAQFETRRTSIVKPLNDSVRQVNDAFKTIEKPLDAATIVLKQKVLTFHGLERQRLAEQERKRAEEEQARQREAEERQKEEEKRLAALDPLDLTWDDIGPAPGSDADNVYAGPPAPCKPQPAVTSYTGRLGSSSVKQVWAFEVMDESLIPREYLLINNQAINMAIRAGTREIAGVRIFQKDQLAIHGGR